MMWLQSVHTSFVLQPREPPPMSVASASRPLASTRPPALNPASEFLSMNSPSGVNTSA